MSWLTFNITSFTGLKSLEILDLRECGVKFLSLHLPELKSFYFSNQAPFFLYKFGPFFPGYTFKYTRKLQNITIAHSMGVNNLFDPIGGEYLTLFDGLKQLKFLTLPNNEFISFPDHTFDSLDHVTRT